MNASVKLKLAGLFTVLTTVITVVQGTLATPPLSAHAVFVATAILTYLAMVFTYAKQYLSPEVNDTGQKVTLVIFIIATVGGVADLLNAFTLSAITTFYIKLSISAVLAVLNIASKNIFPSIFQKGKVQELKSL